MVHISQFELFAVDLPFRKSFKHAAAERNSSSSLFLKCITDTGTIGFGESLPREYVTGETREGAFALLAEEILPNLLDKEFTSLQEVKTFLGECDGKAPPALVQPEQPQTAAWCAVDLALLDTFGRAFGEPIRLSEQQQFPEHVRYSPVISADTGLKFLSTLLKIRLYGFPQVKLKVDREHSSDAARLTRLILGKNCELRADANMAWDLQEALTAMSNLSQYGVGSFEQPLASKDLDGLARLVRESGLEVMADESLSDRHSLKQLIERKACTSVNVRISKCGGLIASLARCQEAKNAGLKIQIGCQVGESSLLSAAHLILVTAVEQVTYAEGCFGLHLLRQDPAEPMLQFGYGGRAPAMPKGAGLGIKLNEALLKRWTVKQATIKKSTIGGSN